MQPSFLLVGGDRRQFWLSRLLIPRGRVFTRGVPGLEDRLPEEPADVLILPTPCLDRAGLLRTGGEGIDPAALAGLCDGHTRVYGGAIPQGLRDALPPVGAITDLLADPETAAANGRLTAEGAAALAAERLEASLWGLSCLVLGYGRVGKPLAELLAALHAQVTVAARRPGVRAEAAQRGFAVRDFISSAQAFPLGGRCPSARTGADEGPSDLLTAHAFPLGGRCPSAHTGADEGTSDLLTAHAFPLGGRCPSARTGADEGTPRPRQPDVIFNTVPAPALSPGALAALGPDCLWVELASAPGGLPADFHPGFPVLPANSLPGRRLPRSAAAVLLEGITKKERDL